MDLKGHGFSAVPLMPYLRMPALAPEGIGAAFVE